MLDKHREDCNALMFVLLMLLLILEVVQTAIIVTHVHRWEDFRSEAHSSSLGSGEVRP